MGKKQHSKDRMFITTTEWATEWGGAKYRDHRTPFKRLPFYCCAVSFTPFEDAVCSPDGHLFDILNIVPYIQKFGRNPVTGKPLALKDLIKLTFHKNADGEYHCPVLKKVFTEFTHIVAVKTTGNVFCYDAIKELNIKPKNWRELLTEEPFTRADIITLQDPNNLNANLLSDFDHVKKGLSTEEEDAKGGASGIVVTDSMKRVLAELPEKGAMALKLGGGGSKAQKEAAAALAVIESSKKVATAEAGPSGDAGGADEGEGREGEGEGGVQAAVGHQGKETKKEGKKRKASEMSKQSGPGTGASKAGSGSSGGRTEASSGATAAAGAANSSAAGAPAMSVVDAASAAVFGRSAAAAKATDEKKARARVAAYAAGARTPVLENTKMVKSAYTSGSTSRGFTSTVYTPATATEYEMVRVEKKPKKKGYARIHTNLGDLNIELHCDIAPRTCENFITLAERGYYDGTIFHRSIRNFMLQGGDPTGTGKGGQSVWGKPFADEFDSRLLHSERGILSMANSGPHSNGSQFFILYKSAPHLNYKHSVFGRIVGGLESLAAMEKTPTSEDDRPLKEIKIEGVSIFVNPYTELDEGTEEEEKAKQKDPSELQKEEEEAQEKGSWFSGPSMSAAAPTQYKPGVGKYLKPVVSVLSKDATISQAPGAKITKKAQASYGNFSNW